MDLNIYHPTETVSYVKTVTKFVPVTVMQEVTTEEVVTEPSTIGHVTVYPVQYRNYPNNQIHIQHKGAKVNLDYGFAFNIPGQANNIPDRYIPSLAGTTPKYAYGSLVVTTGKATLVGVGETSYNVPLNTLPF